VGALVAVFRAYSWGVLLGPTFVPTAFAMLPHSWTMLLEGEGYILAAIFAILIPVRLFARDAETNRNAQEETLDDPPAIPVDPNPRLTTFGSRFRDALLLNLQGSVWVALVLAVAALYEATELILMMR
jgi:hypothetical protein